MRLWSGATAAALTLVASVSGCSDRSPEELQAILHTPRDAAEGRIDFALDGVSITRGGNDEDRSSLSAERIVCRKRTGLGGLVTYHDAREILLTDAELSIHRSSERAPLFPTLAGGLTRSLPPDGMLGALSRATARAPGSITRLVFDGLSLRVEESGGEAISLASKRARFDPASETLVLEGGFELSRPDGRTLRAPLGALSREHDGIYLPMGYALGPDQVDHTAFLVPDAAGGLVAAAVVPVIAYRDDLEAVEQAMVAHFLDRLPGGFRGLLFATLAQIRPGGAETAAGR